MGLSIAPHELRLPPVNPCNLEGGGELELQVATPETAFRKATNFGSDTARPTVPPAGRTLDHTQEFGGPDESHTPGLNSIKTLCRACLLNQHFIKTEASLSTLSFIRTFLIGSFLK